MSLTWDLYADLALALERAYPEADLARVSALDLVPLVTALPEFGDTPTPRTPLYLDLILNAWFLLRQDEAE